MRDEERGFEAAYREALEGLKGADLKGLAERSGAELEGDRLVLSYLGCRFLVLAPDFEVRYADSDLEVPLKVKAIILHYLKDAGGTPPTGRLIDFRELPSGGAFYYPVFQATVERPFLEFFAARPKKLERAASKLGAERVDLGDLAFKIPILPRVRPIFILYRGDEELPPSTKVLFDSSVRDYLTVELVRIVSEEAVMRLIELAEEDG